MSSIPHKIKTMLTTPRIVWIKFSHSFFFQFLPDKVALEIKFKNIFQKKIDWKNPKSFNEKLQWLKMYDRKPEYTIMVDKYAVKEYAATIIGKEHIIPTLGVWDHFEDIDFETLPDKFVLKCTHGSGDVVICKDKKSFDIKAAREKIEKALKADYYKVSREWPYKNVPKKIIAEEYLYDSSDPKGLVDYKIFCFNGVAKFYKVDFDRFVDHHANYYDFESNLLDFGEVACPPDKSRPFTPPLEINGMKELAEKLSFRMPFLRVDFYDVEGTIYLGELTLYPAGGCGRFIDPNSDNKIGELLKLPV